MIVDCEDRYVSVSEWRNMRWLFQMDGIHKSILPICHLNGQFFCECPDNLITSYTRIYQALDSQCKLLVHVYMYLAVKELI